MRATAPRQAATRAATRTTPWAGRLQTALVCVFLTRILYLPPTATGSRGDIHANSGRAARSPPMAGTNPSATDSCKQNLESWQMRQHACGTRSLQRHSRGNRHCGNRYCGNRYCGIRDQGPESSGIGQWHPAPAAAIRKTRCASPLVLLAPGVAGHWPVEPEPQCAGTTILRYFPRRLAGGHWQRP